MKVKCIDASGSAAGILVKGQVYDIDTQHVPVGPAYYRLVGVQKSWLQTRFVIEGTPTAQTTVAPKKVRCIDNTGFDVSLIKGKIYDVLNFVAATGPFAGSGSYLIALPAGGTLWFGAHRFEVVDKDVAVAQPVAPTKDGDSEETRLRALFTRPASGNCPCNIPPPCPYHPKV